MSRVFIREREDAFAGSTMDSDDITLSFCPAAGEAYPEKNVAPTVYEDVYEQIYAALFRYLKDKPLKDTFDYRGVDLLWCFKYALFEYAHYAALVYHGFSKAFREHSPRDFFIEKDIPDWTNPRLFQILSASGIQNDPRLHFLPVSSGRARAARSYPVFLDSVKRLFFARPSRNGRFADWRTVFFTDYEKSKVIAEHFPARRVCYFSSSSSFKVYLKCLREGLGFYQAGEANASRLRAYREKSEAFLERLKESKPFLGVQLADLEGNALLSDKLERLFRERLPMLLYQIDEIHGFFERSGSLRTALLDEDISLAKNAFCQIARRYGVISFVECHGALGGKIGFLPLTADFMFVWGNDQKKKLIGWGCPGDRLLVSGASRYRKYRGIGAAQARRRVARDLDLDPKKPIVLFTLHQRWTPGFFYNTVVRSMGDLELEGIRKIEGAQFVLKLHHGETDTGYYQRWIKRHGLRKHVVVVQKYDPFLLALAADFLVVYLTTYAVDGFAFKKDVILLRDELKSPVEEFEKFGVFHKARTKEEMTGLIRRFLQSPPSKSPLWEKARQECLNEGAGVAPEEIIALHLARDARP